MIPRIDAIVKPRGFKQTPPSYPMDSAAVILLSIYYTPWRPAAIRARDRTRAILKNERVSYKRQRSAIRFHLESVTTPRHGQECHYFRCSGGARDSVIVTCPRDTCNLRLHKLCLLACTGYSTLGYRHNGEFIYSGWKCPACIDIPER